MEEREVNNLDDSKNSDIKILKNVGWRRSKNIS
jgi:hypothetical protein